MSDAVVAIQTAAIAAIEAHPGLAAALNGVFDGVPPLSLYPYVAVGDGLVSDWSTKTGAGREYRLALTVWDDGEEATRLHTLMGQIEEALGGMSRDLPGWRVASNVFVRSLVSRDPDGPWAGLVEYRLRVLEV